MRQHWRVFRRVEKKIPSDKQQLSRDGLLFTISLIPTKPAHVKLAKKKGHEVPQKSIPAVENWADRFVRQANELTYSLSRCNFSKLRNIFFFRLNLHYRYAFFLVEISHVWSHTRSRREVLLLPNKQQRRHQQLWSSAAGTTFTRGKKTPTPDASWEMKAIGENRFLHWTSQNRKTEEW